MSQEILSITLLVFPTLPTIRVARSHWSIFIPSLPTPTRGTVLQIFGTPFTGYAFEKKVGFEVDAVVEPMMRYTLGSADSMEGFDISAAVEEEARKVDVPGASPEPLNPNVGRRCQEWVRDIVDRLVERGVLEAQAREVLGEAKRWEGERKVKR